MLYCSLDIDVFSKFKKSPDTLLFNLILERTLTLLIRFVCKIVSVETAPVDEDLEVASLLAGFLRIAVLVGMCVSNALKKLYSCEHLQSLYCER